MTERASERRHVILVGLMGVGKSVVGQAVADHLGWPFVDVDDVIEASAGCSVSEIFAREGESGFRVLEEGAVADVCAAPDPTVISCGGGAVLSPRNRREIARSGLVVWLTAEPEVLEARVGAAQDRPLLAGGSPGATLARLARLRQPAYEAVADVAIDTSDRTVDDVRGEVLEALAARAGGRR